MDYMNVRELSIFVISTNLGMVKGVAHLVPKNSMQKAYKFMGT